MPGEDGLTLGATVRDRVDCTRDFRFTCGTFAHPIIHHALIVAGVARETRPTEGGTTSLGRHRAVGGT